jgi:hypothetical protein
LSFSAQEYSRLQTLEIEAVREIEEVRDKEDLYTNFYQRLDDLTRDLRSLSVNGRR